MRIYQIALLLTSMIMVPQSVLSASKTSGTVDVMPVKVKSQGIIMTTQFPQPQVWINMMPTIGDLRLVPKVDVFMTLKNNTTQPVTYSFSSSQTFDIFIKDSFGNILSQWSRGLFFLQVLSDITIPPGGQESFGGSIELTTYDGMNIIPGDYIISIKLNNNKTGSSTPILSLATEDVSTGVINSSPSSQMPLRIDWAY